MYLTTAYPLHFGINAADSGDVLIFEIAVSALDAEKLFADEDSLAHAQRHSGSHLSKATLTARFRDVAHEYPALPSLESMGTCAYQGAIPADAVTRIARIPESALGLLVMAGIDPLVSPLNYAYFKNEYEQSVRWLFGDEDNLLMNPRAVRPAIDVTRYQPDHV